MGIPNRLSVKKIPSKQALDTVIKNHYMHRTAPCSIAFGLFDEGNFAGVLIFGKSASTTLRKGVCGPDEASNVYELTRLWLEDSLPRNSESFFISQSLKMFSGEIIVSYAEASVGHVGYVYQATNWLYTGLSSKFKDPSHIDFPNKHIATWAKGMSNKEIVDKWGLLEKGGKILFKERGRKHRYIFFNTSRRRRKELLQKLKYPILPYPKSATVV